MHKVFDPTIDWLADAALTPEQREVWVHIRSELLALREIVAAQDKKINLLQMQPPSDLIHSVLTRPEFNREVARMLAFDERYGGSSSVLYYDFDNLEEIAAQFGKAVVNATIQEIGNVLIKAVRGSDVVGRLAADEFGILLARCNNDDAWKKGKNIAQNLQDKITTIHGCKVELSISYGAYTFTDQDDVSKGLRQAAQVVTKT